MLNMQLYEIPFLLLFFNRQTATLVKHIAKKLSIFFAEAFLKNRNKATTG